jgi:hypothetical protein
MSNHDNFLLITPEGWTELANPSVVFVGYDLAQIAEFCSQNDYGILSGAMEVAEVIAPNTMITQGRVINTGPTIETMRFWYQL